MSDETCEECKFFFPALSTCRRFPPQLWHDGEFRFPVVDGADWRGEFRPAATARG